MKRLFLKVTTVFVTSFTLVATEIQQNPQTRSIVDITRSLLQRPLPAPITIGPAQYVTKDAQFSPDSKQLVTASTTGSIDNKATLWDVNTGQALKTLAGHISWLARAEFSPDGRRVLTASWDNTAKVWDVATGRVVHTLAGHRYWLTSAHYSPDGTHIVTVSADGTAKIWNAASGALVHTLVGHTERINSAEFSPDGTKIATASYDKTAKIWDVQTGTPIITLEVNRSVNNAHWSPDGTKIVTVSDDETPKIWDAQTGELVHNLNGHTDWVTSAHFSPDGTKLVTSSNDGTAKIWDARTSELLRTLVGHTGRVLSAEFSPDGKNIITAASGNAKIWNAETGGILYTLEGDADSAHFSPDGSNVVTAKELAAPKLWKLDALVVESYFRNKTVSLKEQVLLRTLDKITREKNGGKITRADLREMRGTDLFLNVNPTIQNALKALYHLDDDIFKKETRLLIKRTHTAPGFVTHRLNLLRTKAQQ